VIEPISIRDVGPRALLAEFADLDQVMAAAAALRAEPVPGVVDVVPAMCTVLVSFTAEADVDPEAVRRRWASASTGRTGRPAPPTTIPVRYDGVDLLDVAAATGLSVEEVVHRHHMASYTVAFCGFQPGFAYLIGLDPLLHLPRRAEPRPRVDAGSIAIASEFSAVYPAPSPGGWHLLGHTDVVLWDERSDPPALLPPGTSVRFEPSR
jgi:KipI family sensor histidine kinase inhibitor